MINRLPRWVEVGGFVLACIAGSVNAIALLGFNHQGVSHLTGSSTLLGVEMAAGHLSAVLHLTTIVLGFVIGAAASGFVIGNESLKLGRRYSVALLLEALLLLAALHFLNTGSNLGQYLASAACGLQNAMASTYSGAVVRTTHVTGLFTDLGITVGLWLRGQRVDRRRVALYLTLIGGFVVGGTLGASSFGVLHFYAMLGPALAAATLAICASLYRGS